MNRLEHIRRITELRETRYYQQNVTRPRIFRDRGDTLDALNDEEFRQRFRMTRPMCFELVNSVQFDLKYDTKRNHALKAAQQLMITLRFFVSGSFQKVIGDTINVNKSTVFRTIARVTKALLKHQKTIIVWATQKECARSTLKLHENHSFPCVEGIVDGTHIPKKMAICRFWDTLTPTQKKPIPKNSLHAPNQHKTSSHIYPIFNTPSQPPKFFCEISANSFFC